MIPQLPLAHGIGGIRDLPVPTWLFFYSATIVLVASFIALAVLWRRPVLERKADGRPLAEPFQRVLLSTWLRILAGAFSTALFVVVAAAALVGDDHVLQNLAPTFIWVVFWVGLVPFVVVFGNLWAVLSPFRAIADAVAWTAGRLGIHWQPEPYPERLGRWPATLLLLFFVSFELVYENPSDPRALALGIYLSAARSLTRYEGDLAGPFLGSLVPIALVYVLAHYFSLALLQGQYIVPLVSDPFGRGWDLLGTATWRPNLGLLTPNVVWYAQVAALVAGHVAGLALGHDRAVGLFPNPRLALRSQYAMLALIVLYTVGGPKLLSTG